MSAPDHTALEFRAPVVPDPVPVGDEAFAAWLDELAGDTEERNCESCLRSPATVLMHFRDDGWFEVCKACSSDGVLRGGRPVILASAL